jgi:hypothetical protein
MPLLTANCSPLATTLLCHAHYFLSKIIYLSAMENTILFEEVQGFSKKSTLDFFKITIGVLLVSSILCFLVATQNSEQLGAGLLAGALIAAIASFFRGNVRLITQIRSDGIYVRYPPIQRTFSFFDWDSIDRIYLRQYHPLVEYGGWGLRKGLMGSAYIISGTVGIQLIFRDGTKLLIDTNQHEAVATALQRMGKLDYLVE